MNQSKVNPPPFVMMIGIYSTRRMLPSVSVTVPSVLFQSRIGNGEQGAKCASFLVCLALQSAKKGYPPS